MLDQLRMLLLAAGATYMVFRIGSFLCSLLRGYRVWVLERRMWRDAEHPGSERHVRWQDTGDTCARDAGAFSTRKFSDS